MRDSPRIKWSHYPDDVIPAWVAEMDFPVAQPIREALLDLIERDGVGYPPLPIDPRLRDAFVDRQRRLHGWRVDPRSVFSLVNVLQGVDAAVMVHSAPGDAVVLLNPIYGPFHQVVDRTGRLRIDARLVARADPEQPNVDTYEIDWEHLTRQLECSQAKPRILLLSHPHNPTGRAFSRPELDQLAELADRHDLVIVSDEIWADLLLDDDARHVPFATLDERTAERTITLASATKSFNLAGLTCAVMVLGSDALKRRHLSLPPHLIGHCGPLDIQAAITAWTHPGCDAWLEALRVYLRENRESLVERLARDLPAVRTTAPEATYLAWIDCRELELPDERSPYDFFLENARIAFSSGREFGAADTEIGDGYVRLNFATSRLILHEVLDRCVTALRG